MITLNLVRLGNNDGHRFLIMDDSNNKCIMIDPKDISLYVPLLEEDNRYIDAIYDESDFTEQNLKD